MADLHENRSQLEAPFSESQQNAESLTCSPAPPTPASSRPESGYWSPFSQTSAPTPASQRGGARKSQAYNAEHLCISYAEKNICNAMNILSLISFGTFFQRYCNNRCI